jgi:hypothetical protein
MESFGSSVSRFPVKKREKGNFDLKLSRSNRPLNGVSQRDANLVFVSLMVPTGSCSLYLSDVRGIAILVCSCSVEVPFAGASCVVGFCARYRGRYRRC